MADSRLLLHPGSAFARSVRLAFASIWVSLVASGFLVVYCLQNQVLLALGQIDKVSSVAHAETLVLMACSPRRYASRDTVASSEAIADGAILIEALIERFQQRDAAIGSVVMLRDQVIEDPLSKNLACMGLK